MLLFRLCVVLLAVSSLASCGTDLGPCDSARADQVVYDSAGRPAIAGQAILFDSCGAGSFCHSSAALGDRRFGAPAGLDFDVVPITVDTTAGSYESMRVSVARVRVLDDKEGIWEEVESGEMPPGEAGQRVQQPRDWRPAVSSGGALVRAGDSQRLPTLQEPGGAEILRNWLACGAPVVNDASAVPQVQVSSQATLPWVYDNVLQPSCASASCHGDDRAGGLFLGTMCEAYDALVDAPPSACPQFDGARVVAGEPDRSYLLDKLRNAMPACGAQMPLLQTPLDTQTLTVIEEWIRAGAPNDPSCQ